jgi:amino acid adenylation domain-containing protein
LARNEDTLAGRSQESPFLTAPEKGREIDLSRGFLRSVKAHGSRPAVDVSDDVLTYEDLFERSASLAATLIRHQTGGVPPLTAVFAYRSATAFAGILAALMRGHGYVPLNRTFPIDRTRTMLQRSGCRAMIVDAESEKQLDQILGGIEDRMLIVLPERQNSHDLAARWPEHCFIGGEDLEPHEIWRPQDVLPDSIAYLLFTSGSTGVPKGVMVAHRSIRHYIDFMTERFSIACSDRFTQMFDMTFDLSVSDLFVAWECGACVCCPPERTLINPGKFISEKNITVWFSVPSTAVFMRRLGALKAMAYPGLRVSLFCGEALPVEVATAWSAAAPNSVIENLYGPTEVTIACTYYRWDPLRSPQEVAHGIVPIGEPFPAMRPLIVDDSLVEVDPGQDGELLMSGPQLSLGYWNDPILTAEAFVKPRGRKETFYRTGDRVHRPVGRGPLLYLGRVDNQVKILGHRVELGEIEAVVRDESGVDGVVALGWPKSTSGAGGVEVFLEAAGPVHPSMKERVAARLPFYMVPRRYHCLQTLPLNVNGKYDRQALIDLLETLR